MGAAGLQARNYGNDLLGLINKVKSNLKNRQDDVKILSVFLLYLDLIRTYQFSGSKRKHTIFCRLISVRSASLRIRPDNRFCRLR